MKAGGWPGLGLLALNPENVTFGAPRARGPGRGRSSPKLDVASASGSLLAGNSR